MAKIPHTHRGFRKRLDHVFFGELGDFEFLFPEEEGIKGNRAILALHSNVFYQMVYGDLKQTSSQPGFRRAHFLTFLHCMLGLEDITKDNALDICPIAHLYDVKEVLKEVQRCLKPVTLDLQTCCAFYLSVTYELNELKCHCSTQLRNEPNIFNVTNRVLLLGCPKDVLPLVCQLFTEEQLKSSAVVQALLEWTHNMKQRKGIADDEIRSFLERRDLLRYFHLEAFTCVAAYVSFYEKNPLMALLFKEETTDVLFRLAKSPSHCSCRYNQNHTNPLSSPTCPHGYGCRSNDTSTCSERCPMIQFHVTQSVDHSLGEITLRAEAVPVWHLSFLELPDVVCKKTNDEI